MLNNINHSGDKEKTIKETVIILGQLEMDDLQVVSMLAKLLNSGDLNRELVIQRLEYIGWDYADLMLSDENREKDKFDGSRLLTLLLLKGVFMNKVLPAEIGGYE